MKMPIICYVHRLLVCRMAKVTVFMWLAVEILRSWQPRFISFFLLLIHYISSSRHFLETLLTQLSSQLQEESHGEVPWILQHHTAEKLSSFGELALMWVFSC